MTPQDIEALFTRADGSYLYTLPSIVDDGDLGISHIIRGDDHVTNTGVQIAIFRALGLTVPAFGHHNLLTTVSGEGLSKRSGALSLKTLREEGYEPVALASLAVLVGMPGSIDAMPDLAALGERLAFGEASTTASKFDPAELDRLNADLVHAMPFEEARDRLVEMGVPAAAAEEFWAAVRGNCAKVADARAWAGVVFAEEIDRPDLPEEDRAFLRAARDALPEGPLGDGTWREWTGRLKAGTGRKGRALFMPLRLALTGRDHGPELAALMPLMGRERVLARLG